MMEFIKRAWAILLVLGGLLGFDAAGAETARPAQVDRHHGEIRDCQACHQVAAAKLMRAAILKECAQCHSKGIPPRSIKIAQQEQVSEAKPAPTAADRGPGMSVPMYYEKSRLGSAPNEMILIPAGEFLRGSDERLSDEGPAHKVTLLAFWMDKHEVTNLQYKTFIDATQRRSPSHFRNRTYPPGKADHPVTFVSWHDATAYCAWAKKRLPSDVEWEKAARGTDGRIFPWGNEFAIERANTPVRWARLGLDGDTTPVGAFEGGVSPYGLYDMSGNVWEWTSSWYLPYPGNTHVTENYGEKYKVLKGGSWWDCSFYKCGISAPVFNRSFFSPRVTNESFGFRCAKDAA